MILRASHIRFRNKYGMHTYWYLERLTWLGWDSVYHNHDYIKFRRRGDADEFIRIYRAMRRRGGGRNRSLTMR